MRIAIAVENDRDRNTVQSAAEQLEHEVVFFSQLQDALASKPNLVFTGCAAGPQLGAFFNALRSTQQMSPPAPVVVLVPRGAITLGQRAKVEGAADFLFSPVDAREVLAEMREFSGLASSVDALEREQFQQLRLTRLIGEHARFMRCLEELRRAARSKANVLLLGETGTGKEEFARALHELSPRRGNRFLAVNCTALPETLLESELFGHVRGAYTGAESSRQGRFAIVGAGTLLLDEIGDIQPPLQMKLLRVIEQRQFERLGENESVPFHARLVCTTSRNVDQEAEAGRFRPDLLGRINQIRIELPPLRERRSDIPILARFFIEKHRAGRLVDISPTAMEILEGFDFAMNIRQLENAIIHALAQSAPGDLILPLHLPKEFSPKDATRTRQKVAVSYQRSLPYGEARQLVIQAFDQSYLGDLLRQCGGNQVAAAHQAGIDRKTLAERLKHADTDDPGS